jgi:hypothetical protein
VIETSYILTYDIATFSWWRSGVAWQTELFVVYQIKFWNKLRNCSEMKKENIKDDLQRKNTHIT